jgi:hypothetical protein
MSEQRHETPATPVRRFSALAAMALAAALFACSIYANMSWLVTDRDDFRYFPPFKPHVDANHSMHLGAEYFNIAKALVDGRGFSDPWGEPTGRPTAWMPPMLSFFTAGLLWLFEGDKDLVMAVVVFMQVYALIGTGLLVLAVSAPTTSRLWAWIAAAIFFVAVLCNYHSWFQNTHDYWLILIVVDLIVAGFCWYRPLDSKKQAAGWGLFGGLCALTSPIAGFSWGICTLLLGLRQRCWSRLCMALLCAVLAVSPWTIRNYLMLGRLIPVKSNAAYELYQSQCLQPDGLLQDFRGHPYGHAGRERFEYNRLGEMDFLDVKREQFWKSVWADPEDFLDRVAARFFGTLLWYEPFNRQDEPRRPFVFFMSRLTHPLPFLALLGLAFSAAWVPLKPAQWAVGGVYLLYLMPYIAVSYYDRYALPLLGVKVLLVIWGVDRLLSLLPWKKKMVEPKEKAPPTAAKGRASAALASR